jgi:hypothetical protein
VIFRCCDDRRRDALLALDGTRINGIDFLEVVDDPADPDELRQRRLRVRFLHPVQDPVADLPGENLAAGNVRIEGGDRVRDPRVTEVEAAGSVLTVTVAQAGDFSTYTLRLVTSATDDRPPAGFDPVLSSVEFSFKAACPSDFDCAPAAGCDAPAPAGGPALDYLARDYAGFRQLMLDRLAVLVPGWTERNPADLGVALVETLAYVGDYLSYRQDAIATEAYLGTARLRTSVRRHARLVDYRVGDGCNARAWVHLEVSPGGEVVVPEGTALLTRAAGLGPRVAGGFPGPDPATGALPEVFETTHEARLRPEHNLLRFYTWGARECRLPRGATRATLRGKLEHLRAGDALALCETVGPRTGEPEDADPARRHVVVLTAVRPAVDPIGGNLDAPGGGTDPVPLDVTEIEWGADDALPFPLCVSAVADADHGRRTLDAVSVALGNLVLADHGRTLETEQFAVVPARRTVPAARSGPCAPYEVRELPARFRPRLEDAPVTFAAPVDRASARRAVHPDPASALPAVKLASSDGVDWEPAADLLKAGPDAPRFVVETENDGTAHFRFGDGRFGMRPAAGRAFAVEYRVGNGAAGNVGAGALAHLFTPDGAVPDRVLRVWNPLPARGGTDPETLEQVRQRAPVAFRTQERAVTPDDYARMAERFPGVQRAAATFRWTGSWRTVFITVDREGGLPVDAPFEAALREHLERFRMAGHDLEIDGPRFAPLELELRACVGRDHFAADVRAALLRELGRGVLPGGRRAFFHPDHFTFGQPVYLSRVYAAAQAVPGVDRVEVTALRRQGRTGSEALASGRLEVGRLEIARLDNDPNHPEMGVLRVHAVGGK